MDDIAKVPDIVARFAEKGQKIVLQWHGGEPTLAGIDWLGDAIESIEACSDFQWRHDIQTNLIEYTSDWAPLYKRYFGGSIGVSWDYGIRYYKGSNDDYEKRFWANVDQAVSDGLSLKLTVTGARPFFTAFASRFYEFIEKVSLSGIRHIHIEKLTKTGYARDHWEDIGVSHFEYSQYMSRIASSYYLYLKSCHGQNAITLSPFDGLEESLRSLFNGNAAGGFGCWSDKCDSSFHTIDSFGYKRGCTAITSEYDNISTKKISGENAITFFSNPAKARKCRVLQCSDCNFQPICSSGCLCSDKYDSSGECSGSRDLFIHLSNILSLNPKSVIIPRHRRIKGADVCL